MKFLLLALFLAANLVSAADIKLANGRVIRDATVIGVTSDSVIIQSPAGQEQVSKQLLFEPLRSQYAPELGNRTRQVTPGLVMKFSGHGMKQSDLFPVSGKWRVRWALERRGPRCAHPWFTVTVRPDYDGDARAHGSTKQIGPGETMGTGSGMVRIEAASDECAWTVWVEQM